MLRKTLSTLTAIAALGVGSTAMAMHGGGGGGGGHGGGGGGGIAAMHGSVMGPTMMHGGSMGPMTRGGPMTTAPMVGGRVQGWGGRTVGRSNLAWGHDHSHDHDHDRFHHRFHNRFFAFGVAGSYLYDYGYNSCWTQVPTYHGWRWVYVCGHYYPY